MVFPDVDVAVIGGGPAGASTALTLRRHSALSVALFEGSALQAPRLGESLPAAAAPLLHYIGVWKAFARSRHLPYCDIYGDWGAAIPGPAASHAAGGGWRLARPTFDRVLLEEVRSSGARVTLDARVSRVTFKHAAQGWTVQFKHAGTSLECNSRYIVDAGGSAARIARALGAGFVGDDDLYAVVARYPGESPCQTSLLLEPSPIGWWYATALKRESTVVLVTDLAGMRQWMPADRNNWTTLLAATRYVNEGLFGETPSGITARYIPSRRTLPVCGERWIAVGDAAMSADPLSTLGIAFALSSGIGAAHAIVSELNGDNSAREYYGTRAASIFDGYRWSRERFYGAEKRWADEPFWETRRNRYVSGTV